MPTDQSKIIGIAKDIEYIKRDIGNLSLDMKEIKNGKFVTEDVLATKLREQKEEILGEIRPEIKPLRQLLYGFVAMILIAVVGGVLKLVIVP